MTTEDFAQAQFNKLFNTSYTIPNNNDINERNIKTMVAQSLFGKHTELSDEDNQYASLIAAFMANKAREWNIEVTPRSVKRFINDLSALQQQLSEVYKKK